MHIYKGPACFAKAFSVGTCQLRAWEEAGVYQQARIGASVHAVRPGRLLFVSCDSPRLQL